MAARRLLDVAERYITRVTQVLAILVTVVLVSSLLIGIVFRYVLQNSLTWSDEVALLCFTWMVFLSAALGVRDNSHVRIELVGKILPARANWMLNQLIWVAIALTGAFMVWTGVEFVNFTLGQTSAAIRYPTWVRDGSMPISGALIVFYALLNLRRHDGFQQDRQEAA